MRSSRTTTREWPTLSATIESSNAATKTQHNQKLTILKSSSKSSITSLVAQTVKRLSTMWETQVRSLGWEDPLEKEMAIHSSAIAWKLQ